MTQDKAERDEHFHQWGLMFNSYWDLVDDLRRRGIEYKEDRSDNCGHHKCRFCADKQPPFIDRTKAWREAQGEV